MSRSLIDRGSIRFATLLLISLAVFPPAVDAGGSPSQSSDLAAARQAAQAHPSSAQKKLWLAHLLVVSGSLDEALQEYEGVLLLNPRSHEAKAGRGGVLARQGKLQEAEQVLNEALLHNPNPQRVHYELGLLYERLNQFEKAAGHFKEGIKKHELGR